MPDSHIEPGTMAAGGFYSEHSEAQGEYGELGIEWLEQAAAQVPAPAGPFVIADLGAAGGANSLKPMRRAIAARREADPDERALVVHTDIPSNDFTALFELIEASPESYLRLEGVHALAAGRSFYESLFPPGHLALGWSSIAVHWLSEAPTEIPGHIYCSFARGEVRDAFAARSADDWRAFLANRALELIGGGRLVIVGGAALDDGSSGAEGLMELANGVLSELVDAGDLNGAEYARMTIPTWNRTEAEFTAPFGAGGDAPPELELVRHTMRTLPDPYLAAYSQDGDLDTYVAGVAAFFEAAFGPSLWTALDHDHAADAGALMASFDRRLRTAIAAEPERAACTWHVAVLEIAKA